MKLLYVGCRVRIIYSDSWPELTGEEGIIFAKGDERPESAGDLPWREAGGEWFVRPDSWDEEYKDTEDLRLYFTPYSDQLEPVLPDGLLEEIMHEEVEPEMALIAP